MEAGDHLITPRAGYSHHGLYVGNHQVIHYAGDLFSREAPRVCQSNLDDFCQGEGLTIQTYCFRTYGRKESVERALSRLHEKHYHLILNNCEHFVSWCIMGTPSSKQVMKALVLGGLLGGMAGSLAIPFLA